VEALIRGRLRRDFPDHGILGEEEGAERVDREHVWVIDPIDGTKSFAAGRPLFGTLIALVYRGRPVIGVIDQAFTRERWVGVDGAPTTHNGAVVTVSAPCPLARARYATGSPEMYPGAQRARFDALCGAVRWTQYSGDCYAYGL